MSQASYLIVEQQQKAPEYLPQLLKELSQQFKLDIYQCRQRLVGQGLSLLSKGPREQLQKISDRLQETGYLHWLLEPTPPKFAPTRLRGLQVAADKLTFICQDKQLEIPKGANILAVFAEMSGRLAEQSVKQLLSSHAYRGRDDVRHLGEHKVYKTILQGQPLLDIYLLDNTRQIVDGVRVFPGKFDHKGLGERATTSSKQNLDQLLKLTEEYAGDFQLQTDFGLVNLPGCTLHQGSMDDPDVQRKNLLSLARYGWLLADLQRVGPVKSSASEAPAELTGSLAAAMLMQNPTLAATGQAAEVLPIAKEIAQEIEQVAQEEKTQRGVPDNADPGLPPPPPPNHKGLWKKPGFWLGGAGALLGVAIMILIEVDSRTLRSIFRFSFNTGLISFALASLMFWGGFYFVRLKRQVENTPTSKVRSVAMGMVEIKGKAIRQFALISPMSHTPCVFYRLTKYRRKENQQWIVSSVSSSDNVPFLVADETGEVEVDPAGCRVRAGTKQEGVPGQIGLLRVDDESEEKWVEEIIVEGTLLYVLGFAAVKREDGPTITERKIAALRELKRNPQDLQQFDSDGDGKISEDEWDAARVAVEEKVLRESLQAKQQRKKQEQHVVISKKKGRPFIIAETHSEAHLTGRFAAYTVPLFIGAAAATGGGIYQLLNYLG